MKCMITNCTGRAPSGDPFCKKHRDDSAPAGDGVEMARAVMVERMRAIQREEPQSGFARLAEDLANGALMRVPTWLALDLLAAALARPRAAVGEQSREAVRDDVSDLLRKVHWEAWKAGVFTSQDEWPDEDEQADLARGVDSVAVGEHFQGWCDDIVDKLTDRILQSPPAKVEPSTLALVIAAREFWDAHNDMSAESKALDTALEPFAATVPYANDPAVDATTPD